MVDEVMRKQRELNALADRFERLNSFNAELARVTRRKPFQIGSVLAWEAVQSLRRMLIIDLAEWAGSIHAKWLRRTFQGPALAQLRSSKRLAAKLASSSMVEDDSDPELVAMYRQHHASIILEQRSAALRRLFGRAAAERGAASSPDIERLAKKLERWSASLRTLRNAHAHRYGGPIGDVRKIRLADLAKRIRYCGQLLNDLSLLLNQSHYGLPSLGPSERDANSRNLVDLLVVGTIEFAVEQWATGSEGASLWEKRDAHYRRMHSRRRTNSTESFNAPAPHHEPNTPRRSRRAPTT